MAMMTRDQASSLNTVGYEGSIKGNKTPPIQYRKGAKRVQDRGLRAKAAQRMIVAQSEPEV